MPQNHCCLNVVTSGAAGFFTMTDRGQRALRQTPQSLEIGPSRMIWAGDRLVIEIDEYGAPPRFGRLRGRVELIPDALTGMETALTPDGAHVWRPVAPSGRIEVRLGPGLEWSGHGYFDANFGTRPLEDDFNRWTWGRFPVAAGTECHYDAERRDGSRLSLACRIDGAGRVEEVAPPPPAALPRNPWLLRRDTRSDLGHRPRLRGSLLQAPFYSRGLVETRLHGETTLGMHEALDLRLFRNPALKLMLACRVPRRAGWP